MSCQIIGLLGLLALHSGCPGPLWGQKGVFWAKLVLLRVLGGRNRQTLFCTTMCWHINLESGNSPTMFFFVFFIVALTLLLLWLRILQMKSIYHKLQGQLFSGNISGFLERVLKSVPRWECFTIPTHPHPNLRDTISCLIILLQHSTFKVHFIFGYRIQGVIIGWSAWKLHFSSLVPHTSCRSPCNLMIVGN